MKLSSFYPNIINDFEVNFITVNINDIKKNTIFINMNNDNILDIPKHLKNSILIVSEYPILDNTFLYIKTENIITEFAHIYNIYYKLEDSRYKLIGILNDDFFNYEKILTDLFNKHKQIKITFIKEYNDIDKLYTFLSNCNKKEYHYIFWIFHSSELNDIKGILKFDYILLPKSSYSTSFKSLFKIDSYVKSNGVFLANYDDFDDLVHLNNCISVSYNSNGIYNLANVSIHNKIITGTLYKNEMEISEVLFCLNNFDYIYFIISLFALFDNEFQTVDFVNIFFSKYIL